MKIKPEFKLRKVGGMNIIVSTAGMNFHGIITVNDTGEFIWRMLEKEAETEEIIPALAKECNVEESEIKSDVEEFIASLKGAGILG